jgi:hypothetical protein
MKMLKLDFILEKLSLIFFVVSVNELMLAIIISIVNTASIHDNFCKFPGHHHPSENGMNFAAFLMSNGYCH